MLHPRLARACAWAVLATAWLAACSDPDQPGAVQVPPATTVAPDSATTASEPDTTTEPARTIDVIFANGQVAGGARREAVGLGDRVRIRVTSDLADEVHLHTYDLVAAVAPGQPAELELTATIPGRHEVELEKSRKLLLTLEVR